MATLRARHSWLVWVISAVFLLTTPLAGHDFWLASSNWAANPGSTILLTANVGDDTFPVSESFTSPDRVEYVRLLGPDSLELKPKFTKAGESLATSIVLPRILYYSLKGTDLEIKKDSGRDQMFRIENDSDLVEAVMKAQMAIVRS